MSDNHNWQTIGHEAVKSILGKQLAGGQAGHAYLFVGPEGVGKRTLAEEFAGLHSPEPSSVIRHTFAGTGMAELRQLLSLLALRPSVGAKQVAILDAVEQISLAAANALLKTLEEPKDSTVLVLISSQRVLPATVLSRCQTFSFGFLSSKELERVADKLSLQVSKTAIQSATGRASRLLPSEQGESATDFAAWQKDLAALCTAPVSERISMAARFASEEGDALARRLEYWLEYLRFAPALGDGLLPRLKIIWEGWRRLRLNGNKKLVMQHICLNI